MTPIERMFTAGYEQERATLEAFIPGDEFEAADKEAELRSLEYIYEATMWHLENSVAIEQITNHAKEF